jgi:AraC-like DNA-binding protein
MKVETVYTSKEFTAQLITAEYSSAYSEKDFNAYPAISFPLAACFNYRSGQTDFTVNTNHILFEKGDIEFTVSKFPAFKKDITLSLQFLNPNSRAAHFFAQSRKHTMLQKRDVQTEVLLRRLLPLAFGKNEALKEQVLFDLIDKIAFNNGNAAPGMQGRPYSAKQIEQARDFIHAHYADDLRIADIASSANLSSFHFSRLFRKLTGYAPYDYLLLTRIEQAKALLEAGCSATETCFSVGFQSLENFSFAFHKIVSASPSAYKKSKISKIK